MWRDGQKKHVYIYRMVAAGTIEEKVFERQLSKEGLAGVATNEQASPAPSLDASAVLHWGRHGLAREAVKWLGPRAVVAKHGDWLCDAQHRAWA